MSNFRKVVFVVAFLQMVLCGCAAKHAIDSLPQAHGSTLIHDASNFNSKFTSTPAEFKTVVPWFNAILVISVLEVAGGLGVYFGFADIALVRKIGIAVASVGACGFAAAIVAHIFLWLITPVFYLNIATAVAAALILADEVYVQVKAEKPVSAAAAIGEIPAAAIQSIKSDVGDVAKVAGAATSTWDPVSRK